jgi:hypothetical protein
MATFYQVLIILAVVTIGYGVVAAFVGIYALLRHKDEEYKKMYQEHLRQKHRVEDRLRATRESFMGK